MLKPYGNRVVIEKTERETTTASGIVLTDSAKEKTNEGTVVAVGTGRILDNGERVEIGVNVGDRVVYEPFGGTEVKTGEESYIVLKEEDIIAIVE
ncbi:co-chaperone GroES [Macrococcoides canis]|uniref:Co-chaperonin GroES n=1 Tax=Macrococcoides canis TaxID=1855823 RepID=A0A1W7ADY0_9STAP|nr:co-chaperone GroES [Macrococcus canis]ARQ07802.1 10 kDa chaperonin [Macrococcus canis]MEE1106881.1 co-chaperone GroES [Macrococcus canis]TDM16556.1 co-chaperone GroES [Macrococcus canis]TDM19691.1 co-chaperone GroES [Macrococcus canis]TDM22442.1 co-chaperone GroES [Macrococcus canis]